MANESTGNMIVGLDIGTSKVVAVVGEISPDGTLKIVGMGSHPSRGLKKGVIVDIESTVLSIQRAVEAAELMSGCNIHSVYAGIAGSHIRSLDSHAMVPIDPEYKEVRADDVAKVLKAAQEINFPKDQKILHVLPQEYIIDSLEGVKEPYGMSGVRLEAKVHLVTCAISAEQNLLKCISRCNLSVDGIILEQLASSYSVLTDDEKALGVCIVDIGGGTADIAIFTDGSIRHIGVIPIAGDQVTNDIAMALRTPTQHAEKLKVDHACALAQMVDEEEMIKVPGVGDKPSKNLSRQILAGVVEPRYEELFTLIRDEIRRSGYEQMLAGGIVLTGGTAKMKGVIELAEEIFHMSVRIGSPIYSGNLQDTINDPIYSTAVGLLLWGAKEQQEPLSEKKAKVPAKNWFNKAKVWIQNNF